MNALAPILPTQAVDDVDERFPMQPKPMSVKAFRPVVPAFLELFAQSCNISASARALGFSPCVVRDLAKADEVFEQRLEAARIEATDALEGEVRRRAMHGVRKLVTHKGFPVMVPRYNDEGEPLLGPDGKIRIFPLYEIEFSDRLAELLLRGHRPERFTKKQDHVHEFQGKVGVLVVPQKESAEEWAARVASAPKPGELPVIDAEFEELPPARDDEDDDTWLT